MVRLMYVEAISKDEYAKYEQNHLHSPNPHIPSSLMTMKDMDDAIRARHHLGVLCENLSSWQNALGIAFDQGGLVLPRPGKVPSQQFTELQYDHDGMLWRSDWRVLVPRKVVDKILTVEHRLVIRLPNDGFFYVEESVLDIKKSPVKNDRHGQRDGWALVNPEAWENLDPFVQFARRWFRYTHNQKLHRQIMYNSSANRVDICLQCPATLNSVEFSFEPGFPLTPMPDDYWD
jgi:hypothetical protein